MSGATQLQGAAVTVEGAKVRSLIDQNSEVSVLPPCIVLMPNLGDLGLDFNSHVVFLYIPPKVIQGTNAELSPVKAADNAHIFSSAYNVYWVKCYA